MDGSGPEESMLPSTAKKMARPGRHSSYLKRFYESSCGLASMKRKPNTPKREE